MEALLNEKLPSKWTYAVTSDGRVFFLNDDSKASTWIHPNEKQTIQSGHLKNPDLPGGVEFDITDEGISYLIDHNTSTNSWLPQKKVEMRKNSKRSTSPFKRNNSKRKSLKKKSVDVKRDHNSEVVIRDWLYRQEGGLGPLKTWKKRWCVLSDLCLFIYKGPEEGELLGSVLLPSYVITPGQRDSANRKFIFKAEHENMKSEHFAGEVVEEAEKWMEAMHLASMAVDVAGHEDKVEYTASDDQLNLKPSTPLFHEQEGLLHDTQNPNNHQRYNSVIQNIIDYKNVELPPEQITARNNLHLSDSSSKQEASRIQESLNFRNFSADDGCNKIPINASGRSTHSWKSTNALNNLHPESELMPMSLEGSNLSRVREWTEEQNKFRNDILASRSSDEMPYMSSPIKLESRRWKEEEDKLSKDNISTYPMESNIGNFKDQFGRHTNGQQKFNQQSDFYQNNLLKINDFLDKSDDFPPAGNSVLLSQEFAKNNSKDQYVSITKEQEMIKMKLSTKSPVSSNSSNLVRTGISSPKIECVSMKSMKQTSTDISSSPEPSKEQRGMSDVISNVKSHLEESHILFDMLSQLPCKLLAQKEQLVQVLIQLRRDQTSLHELLYSLTTEGNSDSIGQLQAVRELIIENSHMTDQLEGCLYGTSNKMNKASDLNTTENKVEPPKPRKRSTTQTTSPLTTPPAGSSTPTQIENMKEPFRSEHDTCTIKEETRYNFEPQVKNNPNIYDSEKRYESLLLAHGAGTNVPENFKDMNSFIKNEQPSFRDIQNRIYNEDQKLKFNSNPYNDACKKRNEFSASLHGSNVLQNAEQSESFGKSDSFGSDRLKIPNQHVGAVLGKNFASRSDANVSQNVQEMRPFSQSEYHNYSNQDGYKLILDQKFSDKLYNDNGTFELELFQFLETDLDSMHTYNIAKFSHGIKPSDLNKSPSFKKTSAAVEVRSNISRESKPSHNPVARGFEVESPAFIYMKRNLDSSHNKQTNYKNSSANVFHKEIAPNGSEFQATDRCRQSFIPLKGSDDSSKSHSYAQHPRNEMYQEQDSNPSSGARQRTHSLSNNNAKEFKDNMLRNIKSTQNLNKDDDTEDETQAGFQSRSNIRRLSGIFTPRPFYKSRSTNEVQNGSNSRDESFVTDYPERQTSNGVNLIEGQLTHKNEEIPEQPKRPQALQKLIKSQKRENCKWREGAENEKSWRQQMLDQRLGHSQQPSSRTKYCGL